jgi:multicomponent Na+:H+ antiporter subunit D
MNLLILPVLLPLLTAVASLLWGRASSARRVFVGTMTVAQLAAAFLLIAVTRDGEVLVLALGDWGAPYGIVLAVDLLGALMLGFSATVALGSILYGFIETAPRLEHPLRLPLVQFLITGYNLTFCTGDIFNLFVAFEVMLISAFALLTLEADNWDIKQAFPYLAINFTASFLFLCAVGLIYGMFGTLNFAHLSIRAAEFADDPRLTAIALLLLTVFGVKAGLFPLFYWLPNSYPTLPISLVALFGGVLTKVGVYVIMRVFGTVLPHSLDGVYQWLGWIAVVTAILGGLGAVSRSFIRGILAFHIVSQIGLMLLAVSFMTPMGFAAALFITLHNIIVKSSLFLIGGGAACLNKTDTLDRMGNLWRLAPFLGVLFLLQALSLAGFPPLSGFWGKYLIIVVGLEKEAYWWVAGSIAAGMITLFSMLKIWLSAFWHDSPDRSVRLEDRRWVRFGFVAAGLTAVALFMGFGAEVFVEWTLRAGEVALDQEHYADAVFQHLGKESTLLKK